MIIKYIIFVLLVFINFGVIMNNGGIAPRLSTVL